MEPKRRRSREARKAQDAQRSREWRMVVIDQGPLRQKAASECQREMKRLERARADWKRFEQQDKPAFGRWMAATFGAFLTALRENETRIREKEALIEEVEMEMISRGWGSHAIAYAALRQRRSKPWAFRQNEPEEPAESPGTSEAEAEPAQERSEFEEELLFEDFLKTFLGMNPDRLSDRDYARMFADFRAQVLGGDAREKAEPDPAPAPERKPVEVRIKEIYRLLVRRLHPDTRADSDAGVSALWHEVQEAYDERNLERLEMLLAMTDIEAETAGQHTTLFQMQTVLRELRSSLRALQRSIGVAKKELAWGFTERKDQSALEERLRGQFERDLAHQRRQLEELVAFIASWRVPVRRRRSRRNPVNHPEFF